MKPTIASAANTAVPAFLVLQAKGFQVSRSKIEGDNELWEAENEDVRLVAEDPLLLLGLSALYESKGFKWQASGREIDNFLKKFP